jgi:hypothetical protein
MIYIAVLRLALSVTLLVLDSVLLLPLFLFSTLTLFLIRFVFSPYFWFILFVMLWWKRFLCVNWSLWQIDLLENPAIDDVVVLSIVLDEVKNKNLSVYNRLRAICSNPMRKFFVFSNEYHRYFLLFVFCNLLLCCHDEIILQ